MSAIFDGYEREYCELSTQLARKTNMLGSLSGGKLSLSLASRSRNTHTHTNDNISICISKRKREEKRRERK